MKEQVQTERSLQNKLSPFKNEFEKDVFEGLKSSPKKLKSKYFYDSKGDRLFQEIMKLPEYYLTNCEHEILENNKEKIYKQLNSLAPFQLIDLGAGDARKTQILLDFFVAKNLAFTYVPVDISPNAIHQVTSRLQNEIPNLKVDGISGEYLEALDSLKSQRKVILFLGSSVGNFSQNEAKDFFSGMAARTNEDDLVITGFDLKKDPEVILAAYNDQKGVTAKFNLNLLERINRELGADFNLNSFKHYPTYHQEEGETRSSLVSLKEQQVFISDLDLRIKLARSEKINTEISRKFDFDDIEDLAMASGFQVMENLTDVKEYFTNSIWRKKFRN